MTQICGSRTSSKEKQAHVQESAMAAHTVKVMSYVFWAPPLIPLSPTLTPYPRLHPLTTIRLSALPLLPLPLTLNLQAPTRIHGILIGPFDVASCRECMANKIAFPPMLDTYLLGILGTLRDPFLMLLL